MRVTYIGASDVRNVSHADLVAAGLRTADDEVKDFSWLPGQTIEVPDDIGERLVEFSHDQFRNRDDTTRDMRSKDELMERAQELEIAGRSSMNKEELQAAVMQTEIDLENAAAEEAADVEFPHHSVEVDPSIIDGETAEEEPGE